MATILTLDGRALTSEQYWAEVDARNAASEAAQRQDKWYINRRGDGYHETVDESGSYMEAHALRYEYEVSDPGAYYTVSNKPRPGREDG